MPGSFEKSSLKYSQKRQKMQSYGKPWKNPFPGSFFSPLFSIRKDYRPKRNFRMSLWVQGKRGWYYLDISSLEQFYNGHGTDSDAVGYAGLAASTP